MDWLARRAVPAHSGVSIAGFARSGPWTALGARILWSHVVDPALVIPTIEGTRKAIARLLSVAGTVVPAQVLLCIMHFVHLTLVA